MLPQPHQIAVKCIPVSAKRIRTGALSLTGFNAGFECLTSELLAEAATYPLYGRTFPARLSGLTTSAE
jgi:hypothetical protein